MFAVRKWLGVPPTRDRLDESAMSESKPCLTAAVIRGTIFSTMEVMRDVMSGMDAGRVGMALRSSCISCRSDKTTFLCPSWMAVNEGILV